MQIIDTPIHDVKLISPKVFGDNRGYFSETFKSELFPNIQFIQDNEAYSDYGVIRGLHWQEEPYQQCKLVRCVYGEILDVAVDIRKNSPTYLKHVAYILSAENMQQLLVPRGFAHGYAVLSNTAKVLYKVDNVYAPKSENGLLYNSDLLTIDWLIPNDKQKLSEKDLALPSFINFD